MGWQTMLTRVQRMARLASSNACTTCIPNLQNGAVVGSEFQKYATPNEGKKTLQLAAQLD